MPRRRRRLLQELRVQVGWRRGVPPLRSRRSHEGTVQEAPSRNVMQNVPKPVCLMPHAWSTPASGPSISSTMNIASLTSHLAIALVVLTACSSSEAEWADGSVPVHEQYRAPDSVQRIEWSTVSG